MPIFAPAGYPPCLMTSVILLKHRHKTDGAGSRAAGGFDVISSGRNEEKLYPTPPPALKIIDAAFSLSIMESMESSRPKTKQSRAHPQKTAEIGESGSVGHKPAARHRCNNAPPPFRNERMVFLGISSKWLQETFHPPLR